MNDPRDLCPSPLSEMLEQYREGTRGMPSYDELAALLNAHAPLHIFGAANPEQNKQLARDAQSIVDADVAALPKDCSGTPASCPDNEGHGCACSPIAAAPQVVADERRPELTVWYGAMPESNGRSNFTATLMRKGASVFDTSNYTFQRSEYPDRTRYEADCMRHLIGELAEEPSILDYDADKHSGYVAPVQPVAVPDVDYPKLLAKYIEHVGTEEGFDFLGRLWLKDGAYVGYGDKAIFSPKEYEVLKFAADFDCALAAAPAVQGDAHKSPASFSDHIRWVIAGVRNGHGADDVAINNMRAWHESKVKASKAPVADKKSIRYDFLRLDDQQYYVAFRDQFGAFRQIREKELDKTIDAAIAAKAVKP